MSEVHADALVLGGGPAGAAAAMVLAQAGRHVTLVRPTTAPGASLGQSIPPSARPLLEELGLARAMDEAGFVPNLGNTVAWAETPVRREGFAEDASGYHVDRGGLEALLDRVLRSAGVEVREGLHARTAERSPDGWRLGCQGAPGGTTVFQAPWVVDATGRHGFLARRLGRIPDRRTSTLALVGRWRVRERGDDPDEGHTVIGSHGAGWAWSVPLSRTTRCVTAMVDPRHAPLDSGDLEGRLRTELARVPLLAGMLSQALHLGGTVWACPASLYTSRHHAEDGVLLAGDAGSFIDPLSSYGVKKALISGRLAGIVAASCLDDPAMSAHGTAYFDAHERSVAADYRARAADFFESAADAYGEPFWTDRLAARGRRGYGGSRHGLRRGPRGQGRGACRPPRAPCGGRHTARARPHGRNRAAAWAQGPTADHGRPSGQRRASRTRPVLPLGGPAGAGPLRGRRGRCPRAVGRV